MALSQINDDKYVALGSSRLSIDDKFYALRNGLSERQYWLTLYPTGTGSLNDIKYQYFKSLGYTGSIQDMEATLWRNGLSNPLAVFKNAANAAPATTGAVPTSSFTITYQAANAVPDTAYNRYWISGSGKNNGGGLTTNPKLNIVTTPHNFANWGPVFGGGVTANQGDGSAAEYWLGSTEATVQVDNPCIFAFTTNSRYVYFPGFTGFRFQVEVNGAVLPNIIEFTANNQNVKIDMGTAVSRNIIIRSIGSGWVSEVSVTDTATIVPYTVTPNSSVKGAFMGDSYMQDTGAATGPFCFIYGISKLMGMGPYSASTIGGTGHYANNSGDPVQYPNANNAARLSMVSNSAPQIVLTALGINDPAGEPLVQGAISTYYNNIRTLNPNALLVMISPWAPNEAAGANPGGKYQQFRTWQIAALAGVSGNWIYLDGLNGGYRTSKGAVSAFAGPWQVGDGSTTTTDGTHPTQAEYANLTQKVGSTYKAALATM